MTTLPDKAPHPAKFSDVIIERMIHAIEWRVIISPNAKVLDPFGGTRKVFKLLDAFPRFQITALEIEPRWASHDPRITQGDALDNMFPDEHFDMVVTSPCLAHGQRILTDDLEWVDVKDIKEGQGIIAFDEFPTGTGKVPRRRFRHGVVTHSKPQPAECVTVTLSNGDSIVCTLNHPWIARPFKSGGNQKTGYTGWVMAKDLIKDNGIGMWVDKQFTPWASESSYESGYLSGVFDGEGSVSWGDHGSPKLMFCQRENELLSYALECLDGMGIDYSLYERSDSDVLNVYILGGFPGVLSTAGRIRPRRLLKKFDSLGIHSRTVQPERVQVVSVESAGTKMIQGIETSTGTYFGEGYLHHNTYGNRMADHHNAKDGSKRNTYTHQYGETLHANNSGTLQWGQEYRDFHREAWTETVRSLTPGGFFILNIKDHIRKGKIMKVCDWHCHALYSTGLHYIDTLKVKTPGNRQGQNGNVRVDHEELIIFEKP